MNRKIVIFDMDGTLTDSTHRHHFVQRDKKDWASFFASQHLDPPRQDVVAVLHMYNRIDDISVVILTGRGEEHREVSAKWLRDHGIRHEGLFMRPLGDRTDDNILKLEQIQKWQDEGHEIVGLFDDRKRICDAARDHGITVFQMAAGEF